MLFPSVNGQQRREAQSHRDLGIGGFDHLEQAAIQSQPSPDAPKL